MSRHADEQLLIDTVFDGQMPEYLDLTGGAMFSERDKAIIAQQAWNETHEVGDPDFHSTDQHRLVSVVHHIMKSGSAGVEGLQSFESRVKEIVREREIAARAPVTEPAHVAPVLGARVTDGVPFSRFDSPSIPVSNVNADSSIYPTMPGAGSPFVEGELVSSKDVLAGPLPSSFPGHDALVAAGITTYEQLATHDSASLLAIHGLDAATVTLIGRALENETVN